MQKRISPPKTRVAWQGGRNAAVCEKKNRRTARGGKIDIKGEKESPDDDKKKTRKLGCIEEGNEPQDG